MTNIKSEGLSIQIEGFNASSCLIDFKLYPVTQLLSQLRAPSSVVEAAGAVPEPQREQ